MLTTLDFLINNAAQNTPKSRNYYKKVIKREMELMRSQQPFGFLIKDCQNDPFTKLEDTEDVGMQLIHFIINNHIILLYFLLMGQ